MAATATANPAKQSNSPSTLAAGKTCGPHEDHVTSKGVWQLIKQTFSEFSEDKASRLGAGIAYYAIFSMAPLLLLAVSIATLAFRDKAPGEVQAQLAHYVGPQGGQAIESMLKNSDPNKAKHTGTIMTIVSLVTALIGASTVFAQLQDALNTIWEVTPKPGRGIWGMIRDRGLTFLMVLGIGILAFAALVLNTMLAGAGHFVGKLPFSHYLQYGLSLIVTTAVMTVLCGLSYKVLPDVKMSWKDVWVGSIATAILFTIGQWGIGLYLGKAGIGSPFGAAGSLAVLLVWIYYSVQIYLLGAEFTKVFACRYGTKIVPTKNAVPVTEQQRAQQGIPRKTDIAQAAALDDTGSATGDVSITGGKAKRRKHGKGGTDSDGGGSLMPTLVGLTAGVILGRLTKPRVYRPVLIQARGVRNGVIHGSPRRTLAAPAATSSHPSTPPVPPPFGRRWFRKANPAPTWRNTLGTLNSLVSHFRKGWKHGVHEEKEKL